MCEGKRNKGEKTSLNCGAVSRHPSKLERVEYHCGSCSRILNQFFFVERSGGGGWRKSRTVLERSKLEL